MAKPVGASVLRHTCIIGAALLLRLAVVWLVARAHPAAWFFGQATELARLAESMRSGQGLSSPFADGTGPSAFLAPGYPALVAVVFALFRPYSYLSAVALMCLQACFGAATVWALMRLTRQALGDTTAAIAGVLSGVAPPLLWLPTLFWETSLSMLLATVAALLALHSAERPSLHVWLGAGSLTVFALAVNPSLLPIMLCCFGWAAYQRRSQPLLRPALGVGLCVLLWMPWGIRNYRQLHSFIPLRDNLSYELWQGNRIGGNGLFSPELHPNVNTGELQQLRSVGEVSYMREKGAIAKATILERPLRFALLTLRRAFYFWVGNVTHSPWVAVAYTSITTILGFAGLLLIWRDDRRYGQFFLLPLLFFPLPYYITHADFRFRLVLDPLLIALTAYALTQPHPEKATKA